jgi:hypothetical protein
MERDRFRGRGEHPFQLKETDEVFLCIVVLGELLDLMSVPALGEFGSVIEPSTTNVLSIEYGWAQ